MKEFFKWGLFVLGLALLAQGIYLLNQDLSYLNYVDENNPMFFNEYKYVGGDAYNYIISAARSTAVMVKSLIYVVMGCSSLLISRTIHS